MPEMLAASQNKLPEGDVVAEQELNDKVSGIMNSCYGIGQILGPNIGSFLTGHYGFRAMCDYQATFLLCFGALYIFVTKGFRFFKYKDPETLEANKTSQLLSERKTLLMKGSTLLGTVFSSVKR